MRTAIGLIVSAFLLAISSTAWSASCTNAGPLAPITEMNVNSMFPITIGGQTLFTSGGARQCAAMKSAGSTCVCPSRLLGAPSPGIMLTMFIPTYVAEVQGEAGCSPLLGIKLTSAFDHRSTSSDNPGEQSGGDDYRSTRQIHWIEYPAFSMLQVMKDSICLNAGNELDIAYMTEFDPIWQNDQWAAVLAPEGALFGNFPSVASCIVDSVSATTTRCPIDAMVWCSGSGFSYPWSATQNHTTDHADGATKTLQKFLQRQTRAGVLQRSVGPDAKCSPLISPVMARSQWRIDLIHPLPRGKGRPIVLGTDSLAWGTLGPVPMNEGAVFLVWQGMQCCLRI